MMAQSHNNDWFNIFLCDFQLRTKKFYYHIHIAHFITRHLTHHEFTQDSINSRIFCRIVISKSLQPCLHIFYLMNILETYGTSDLSRVPFRISSLNDSVTWLIVDFLRTSANRASSFALGLASVILIFLIGGVTSGITIRVSALVKQCFQKYIFVSTDERLVHLRYWIISWHLKNVFSDLRC